MKRVPVLFRLLNGFAEPAGKYPPEYS